VDLINNIKEYLQSINAEFKEKKGAGQITLTVAERKTFLSKQKLTYEAKFRVDEKEKVLRFTEMLKESSAGMASAGAEFTTTNYKTGKGGQQESVIEQQSRLFGKKYDYVFDFKSVRDKIESLAHGSGYDFEYRITDKGI
jgi:hypothetical protein